MIIETGIREVVIGTKDPHDVVAGKGIKKLEDAGIKVSVNILSGACLELNRRFFTFHEKRRPYIILKWAESANGFISPAGRDEHKPVYITNEYSRLLVHKMRAEEQSILIGTQTAIDDNPMLTVRHWTGQNPVRIVLDKNSRISKESYIFDNQSETIVFSGDRQDSDIKNVSFKILDFDADLPFRIATELYHRKILSVLIEGGRMTLQSFIDAGFWDEARIFRSGLTLGGGTKAPEITGRLLEKVQILNDELLTFRK